MLPLSIACRIPTSLCGRGHLFPRPRFASHGKLILAARERPLHLIGFALYGASLILLYLASTLYHSLRVGPRQVARLQRFDFVAIFLLIAGTFTPLCLITLRGSGAWGWSLLAAEYTIAFAGILSVLVLRDRFPAWLRMTLYLGMGWLAFVAAVPFWKALPLTGVIWLIAGGLTYSLGAMVLALDRPHLWPGRFSAHDLWHVFVLAGSACHFVLMLGYVAPAT